MSDHIEAMARELFKVDEDGWIALFSDDDRTDARRVAAKVWAAGVEPLIAHKPCGGGGIKLAYDPATMHGPTAVPCLGPHTVIVKGDGTKLYADVTKASRLLVDKIDAAIVPLPPEWRIE